MLKGKTTILIFVIAMLIISTASFSFAQYINRQEKQNAVVSSNFYFKINYANNIASSTPYYLVGNQINIALSNTDGLNINTGNITYSVKVEDSLGTDITSTLTITGNDGTLLGGQQSVDNISISGISQDTLYIVEISSTSPYTKTLSAKFMLRSAIDTYYTITDNGIYIVLDLFIGSVMPANNLTINYGTNLAPDNTNDLMANWVNATSGTITASSLATFSNYSFIFVEQNASANYNRASTSLNLSSAQTITITPI